MKAFTSALTIAIASCVVTGCDDESHAATATTDDNSSTQSASLWTRLVRLFRAFQDRDGIHQNVRFHLIPSSDSLDTMGGVGKSLIILSTWIRSYELLHLFNPLPLAVKIELAAVPTARSES